MKSPTQKNKGSSIMSVLVATGLTAMLALAISQIMAQSYRNISNIEGLVTVIEVMNDFRFAFAKEGTCQSNIAAGVTHLDAPEFNKSTISATTPAAIEIRKILGLSGTSTTALDPLKVLFIPDQLIAGSNRIKMVGARFLVQNEITENVKYSGSLILNFDRGEGVTGPRVIQRRMAMTFDTTVVSGTTLRINNCRVTADEVPTTEINCTNLGGTWASGTCNFATGITISDTCLAFGGTWDSATLSCTMGTTQTQLADACRSFGGTFDSATNGCALPVPPINASDACVRLGGTWTGSICDFAAGPTSPPPPTTPPPPPGSCNYDFSSSGGPTGTLLHSQLRTLNCDQTGQGDMGTITYQCWDGVLGVTSRTCRNSSGD